MVDEEWSYEMTGTTEGSVDLTVELWEGVGKVNR